MYPNLAPPPTWRPPPSHGFSRSPSPAHSENVNIFGSIPVDIERELAKLDSAGYRPFREPKPAGDA